MIRLYNCTAPVQPCKPCTAAKLHKRLCSRTAAQSLRRACAAADMHERSPIDACAPHSSASCAAAVQRRTCTKGALQLCELRGGHGACRARARTVGAAQPKSRGRVHTAVTRPCTHCSHEAPLRPDTTGGHAVARSRRRARASRYCVTGDASRAARRPDVGCD